ncbi:MAG TPA: amidohydrolase family protein [Mucilaginibacter sp.]
MILENVNIIGNEEPADIRICNGKIADVTLASAKVKSGHLQLAFSNAIAFPGLINSHDHLDFNLFPQFGTKTYNNYTEWGKHIQSAYKNEIAEILKIPARLRAEWGVYKNLLCGVTTVVNHGEKTGLGDSLINVFEDSHCLHSIHFEKKWRMKLNNPLKKEVPVNIHVGEGSDAFATEEIDDLVRYNVLHRRLVGVHGVAMTPEQAAKFEALVWCPESNYFLLNKTAEVGRLSEATNILFGTDSTLTGHWNIWEHIRLACKTGLLTDDALYKTLNQNPAKAWRLNAGSIAEGKDADIVVARSSAEKTGLDAFYSAGAPDILLVIHKGEIVLFDEVLKSKFQGTDGKNFSSVYVAGCAKYVKGDLPALISKIRDYQPAANFPVTINEPVHA